MFVVVDQSFRSACRSSSPSLFGYWALEDQTHRFSRNFCKIHQDKLHNNAEERRPHLHRGGSLMSRRKQISLEAAERGRDKSSYKKTVRHSYVWRTPLVVVSIYIPVLNEAIFNSSDFVSRLMIFADILRQAVEKLLINWQTNKLGNK
jgi:hypothetical protein